MGVKKDGFVRVLKGRGCEEKRGRVDELGGCGKMGRVEGVATVVLERVIGVGGRTRCRCRKLA